MISHSKDPSRSQAERIAAAWDFRRVRDLHRERQLTGQVGDAMTVSHAELDLTSLSMSDVVGPLNDAEMSGTQDLPDQTIQETR